LRQRRLDLPTRHVQRIKSLHHFILHRRIPARRSQFEDLAFCGCLRTATPLGGFVADVTVNVAVEIGEERRSRAIVFVGRT